MDDRVNLALLIGAAVLLVAVGAVRLTSRARLPTLVVYVAIGLLIGEGGDLFNDADLAQNIGLGLLMLILAEGGLTTNWHDVRPMIAPAVSMATIGVGVSMSVTGLAAHWVLGTDWRTSFLVGAIVGSTDAAATFSILRAVPLPRRLSTLLEAESSLNDPAAVVAVVLLTSSHPQTNAFLIGADVVYQLAAGAVIGYVLARLGVSALRHVALPASGLYPIAVLAFAVAAYSAAASAHASGFLAVYVAGLVLGNSRLPHRPATRGFAEGIAWLSQIGLFVMLGLLAVPSRLPDAILPAIAIGLALLLISRPLSVLIATIGARLRWNEQVFLSWAGLRGAVPIVLATIPMTSSVIPGSESERVFDIVFVLVVVFTLIQGPPLPRLAHLLRLDTGVAVQDLDLEAAPLGRMNADVLQVSVPDGSRMHGVEIFELRLPRDAAVTLVVRDGQGFVPDDDTELRTGDDLLVVTTAESRELVERRLRAISRDGKLARWHTELDGRDAALPAATTRRARILSSARDLLRRPEPPQPQAVRDDEH